MLIQNIFLRRYSFLWHMNHLELLVSKPCLHSVNHILSEYFYFFSLRFFIFLTLVLEQREATRFSPQLHFQYRKMSKKRISAPGWNGRTEAQGDENNGVQPSVENLDWVLYIALYFILRTYLRIHHHSLIHPSMWCVLPNGNKEEQCQRKSGEDPARRGIRRRRRRRQVNTFCSKKDVL